MIRTLGIASSPGHRAGRASTLLLAALFAFLGLAVYFLGIKVPPTKDTKTVRAVVRLPANLTNQDQARRQILAVSNVDRAIRVCERKASDQRPCSPASVKSARDRLRVWETSGHSLNTSLANVHIECAFSNHPDATVALVNRLADQFADSVRKDHQTESGRAYRQAKQETAEAKNKLDEAQKRLDAHVEKFLKPTDAQPDKDKPTAQNTKRTKTSVNPDWLAVRGQLDHVQAYRQQLLVDRTPLHPMVRAADVEIEELERRLAKIPHELVPVPGDLAETLQGMTDPLPEPPGLIGKAAENVDTLEQPLGQFVPPTQRPVTTDRATGQITDQAAQPTPPQFASREHLEKFLMLKHEVDVAQQDYERALAHQQEVLQRGTDLPPIEIVAAHIVAGPAATTRPRSRVALFALMVALAGTVGVGMVTSGIADHTTFANPAQARAALAVPVLATVSGTDHADSKAHRRHLLESSALVLCGMFLLAATLGVLLAATGVATILF